MAEYIIDLDGISLDQLLNGKSLYFDLPDYPIDKIAIIPTPNSATNLTTSKPKSIYEICVINQILKDKE